MPKKPLDKRILHVDDEEDIRIVVKTLLEGEGYKVTSADSGASALKEIAKAGTFDLLILDIMMPDMTGWDLFINIAKLKPEYPTIFLSILEISEEKLKELKDNGVRDFIKKPFDNKDLVARVKRVIERK